MFSQNLYPQVLLAVAGGLLTLLGSVGIFISLIVQRRVERLQDVLEEFINLSYRSESNLTGHMYNLIEKYQMHYLFPRGPHRQILHYIDLNIFFIMALWLITLFMGYSGPAGWQALFGFLPLAVGFFAALFFRRLLQNTINLENPLLGAIIPAPSRLRSISYLSHFVNISVKSVLKQARLTLLLIEKENGAPDGAFAVILKEELSVDDFFYFLILRVGEKTVFISYGEILFRFLPDPITGKPVPVKRNINIPLGYVPRRVIPLAGAEPGSVEPEEELTARLLVFTHGEKFPVEYHYRLQKETSFFTSESAPELTVNHQITYVIKGGRLQIMHCEPELPYCSYLGHEYVLDGKRYYAAPGGEATPAPGGEAAPAPNGETKNLPVAQCREDSYID